MNAYAASRLPFALRPFERVAWVSDSARQVWEPRMSRIRLMALRARLGLVASGGARAAVLEIPVQTTKQVIDWIGALHLPWHAAGVDRARNARRLAVGAAALDVAAAARSDDAYTLAKLTGVPDCCAEAEVTARASGVKDRTWLAARSISGRDQRSCSVSLHAPEATNFLLLNRLSPTRHLPCSFECEPTLALVRALAEQERQVDEEAAEWQSEILEWSCEWSALHGIAELVSPTNKWVYSTDATAARFEILHHGTREPAEMAIGTKFPFAASRNAPVAETAACSSS